MLTRRGLLVAGAGLLAACSTRRGPVRDGGGSGDVGVLTARPGAASPSPGPLLAPGTHPLGLAAERDVLLHVPSTLPAGGSPPLVLSLHGAGGDAGAGLALLRPLAEERGLLVVAPASRGSTWDAVGGSYGADAELVDRALELVFAAFAVPPDRVAVAGFSDGASYALGLGLANGGLFRDVLAFSPGFVPPGAPRRGRPRIFVSHGDADDVLPIDRTSRRIVPALRDDGYDVTYREFAGPHVVPPEIAREAVDRLV
ncbi:Predicted esterase [Blastococcus aurantiacus]|uniref:Predicted esterase n=1 Tax=Blastococcus aurantiacus TaxID=1550231 RepID=A0A1G7HIX5_9ACTN|nr:alpha/beta hydrolase-fold protein [Blastococcus aurantiacus]SDF00338.1 Predicted esterase [Blastococcus aurantiacus]